MKELTTYPHKYTDVVATDEPVVPGMAHHKYQIKTKGSPEGEVPHALGEISFQNGPIKEAGVCGVMDENLLAILIDRLQGFQSGPYKSRENAIALTHLEEAMLWLNHRTAQREARGVEGTHTV